MNKFFIEIDYDVTAILFITNLFYTHACNNL